MKRKSIKIICICFIAVIILLLVYLFAGETIYTFVLKQRIIHQLKNDESNLNTLIDRLSDVDESMTMEIYREDVKGDQYLEAVFEDFNLKSIYVIISKNDDRFGNQVYLLFTVEKQRLPRKSSIEQGFYYTDSDEPARYMGIFDYADGKIAKNLYFYYIYNTEKVIDNIWYYEFQFVNPPSSRR